MPKANAAELLTAYWGNISRDWDPGKRNSYRARLTENNGYRKGLIISLIEQYFEPEDAFTVGLSASA